MGNFFLCLKTNTKHSREKKPDTDLYNSCTTGLNNEEGALLLFFIGDMLLSPTYVIIRHTVPVSILENGHITMNHTFEEIYQVSGFFPHLKITVKIFFKNYSQKCSLQNKW